MAYAIGLCGLFLFLEVVIAIPFVVAGVLLDVWQDPRFLFGVYSVGSCGLETRERACARAFALRLWGPLLATRLGDIPIEVPDLEETWKLIARPAASSDGLTIFEPDESRVSERPSIS